jgi:hypothetical protein
MFGASSERSLICSIAPKKVAHIHPVLSTAFKETTNLLDFLATSSSIICDFYLKTTGKSDVCESTLQGFPVVSSNQLKIRALSLNSLTTEYTDFWQSCYQPTFIQEH